MHRLNPKSLFLLLFIAFSLLVPLTLRGDSLFLDSSISVVAAGLELQADIYDIVPTSSARPIAPQYHHLAGFNIIPPSFHAINNMMPAARAIPSEDDIQVASANLEYTPSSLTSPVLLMDRMMIVQPASNRSVLAQGWNFFGSGVAGVPMYVNGELITNRTVEGFFSVFMPLDKGENRFIFTQEGQESITRIITQIESAPPTVAPIVEATQMLDPFPQSDEWAQSGATLPLRVIAPAGAVVYAQIGGVTIPLAQTNPNLVDTGNAIFAAEFTGTYTLPNTAPHDVLDIGRPTYTMTFRGHITSITATGYIHQIGSYAPFYARITVPATWAFPGPTIVGGTHWMLLEGQRDRVSAITGNWLRLASGQWVSLTDATTWIDDAPEGDEVLSLGRYIQGEQEDIIAWDASVFLAMWVEFDGNRLIVVVGMQNYAPAIIYHPDYAIFESISIGTHNGAPAYIMTLKEDAQLEGFYFEHTNNQLRLVLRKRPALNPGNYPLYGFTFVIDPGHGGNDPGALGPMGRDMAEMHINWINSAALAEMLENLGAQVILTRNADEGLVLSERVAISRNALPDMFISMHANSTAETTNAGNIHGFSMWYRNASSRPLAQHFFDALYDINPLTNRNMSINQANFYVVRPSWAPSVLFEVSFMNNIQDFAWMIDPQNQADLARGIVDAILDYFSK